MAELNNTAHKILDVAERYTMLNGFNGFSYKHVQNEVGVKTSTIHYYFPTKQDLALTMVERYIEQFSHQLAAIEQQHQGIERLKALGQIYIDVVSSGKFCMCGMLASDMLSLPENVNHKLCQFFSLLEDWLTKAIQQIPQATDDSPTDAAKVANHFLAALEGGMLIARVRQQPQYLSDIVNNALAQMS